MNSLFQRLRDEFIRLTDQFRDSEMVVLVATSALVGLGAGGGALAFRWLIDSVELIAFEGGKTALTSLGAQDGG